MTHSVIEDLDALYQTLQKSLIKADGQKVVQTLVAYADFEFHIGGGLPHQKTSDDIELCRNALIELQSAIRALAKVISYEGQKAARETKRTYQVPLTFSRKWNGKSPDSMATRSKKISKAKALIAEIYASYPNATPTEVAKEVGKTLGAQHKLGAKVLRLLVAEQLKRN